MIIAITFKKKCCLVKDIKLIFFMPAAAPFSNQGNLLSGELYFPAELAHITERCPEGASVQ